MAKRTRNVPVLFWVSPQEMELIRQKMAQFGTDNLSAYLRKMAIRLDLYFYCVLVNGSP